jgi:hypothetical protein
LEEELLYSVLMEEEVVGLLVEGKANLNNLAVLVVLVQ